eukprot:8549497-Pyramimonas_sp.AAC.1
MASNYKLAIQSKQQQQSQSDAKTELPSAELRSMVQLAEKPSDLATAKKCRGKPAGKQAQIGENRARAKVKKLIS